jgi:predicted dehydrogenase
MTVRLAVIGGGNVAEAYLLQIGRMRLQGRDLCASVLCTRQPERGRDLQRRFAIGQVTGTPAEAIERDDVDAVLVLTSADVHAGIARLALEAGKDVLVEKPLAVTLEDARSLAGLARRLDRRLVCAPHTLLSPTFQSMLAHVRGGDLGRVVSARGLYGWPGPDWASWFYGAEAGPLFDLGVYNLTTLTALLGPVARVTAMAGVAVPQRLVLGRPLAVTAPDNVQVLLEFGSGGVASLTASFAIQRYRTPGLELYGTEGTMQILGDDWAPGGYELWRNAAHAWTVVEDRSTWPWTDGVRDLVDAIEAGRDATGDPAQACHVLEVMILAKEAARTGQTLAVTSTFAPPPLDPARAIRVGQADHDPLRL